MTTLAHIGGGTDVENKFESNSFSRNEAKIKFVDSDGDKMTGSLNMNGNQIINLAHPKEDNDATNKEYVLDQFNQLRFSLAQYIDNNIDKIAENTKKITALKEIDKVRTDLINKLLTQVANLNNAVAYFQTALKEFKPIVIQFNASVKSNTLYKIIKVPENKKVIILQVLISTDIENLIWRNIYLTSYTTWFDIIEKKSDIFIDPNFKKITFSLQIAYIVISKNSN